MKTEGMAHQLEALARAAGREGFGFLMEQGTGKTWTAMAEAEGLYEARAIDAMIVFAPNGVHTNWTRREIPAHMACETTMRAWKSGMSNTNRRRLEELFSAEATGLRILSINFEALNTEPGYQFALRFVQRFRCYGIVDESQRIKTPEAARTKKVISLRPYVPVRRIASGTPITKQPADIFMQMEWLGEGLLGTTNYRAFCAEYHDLLNLGPAYNIIQKIKRQQPCTPEEFALVNDIPWAMKQRMERDPKMRFAQIIRRDAEGRPIFKNLDKLQGLIAQHSYRKLKSECLDLPPKIYKNHYFELTPRQRAAYELMEKQLRYELENGQHTPVSALASLVKLSQITSGFIIKPDGEPLFIEEEASARMSSFLDLLEDVDGKIIVWARFREELRMLRDRLREAGRKVVEYHGGIKQRDRDPAIDAFQGGDADAFLGQAGAGGLGLTLTAGGTAFYYSDDFNRENRAQSEDRNHRKGTKDSPVYYNLCAVDTIDESIARSHQYKADMAATILGDRRLMVQGLIDEGGEIIELL